MCHYTALLSIGLDRRFTLGHCHIDPPHRLAGVSSLLVRFRPRRERAALQKRGQRLSIRSDLVQVHIVTCIYTIYIAYIYTTYIFWRKAIQQRFLCAFDFLWMGKILSHNYIVMPMTVKYFSGAVVIIIYSSQTLVNGS